MAGKIKNSKLIKDISLFHFLLLITAINSFLFAKMIFFRQVPIAFDYGLYNYQPWKLDYEAGFTQEPKRIGHDDIRIFYPQKKFIIESIKSGNLPFWNPYEFSGNVSLANSQTAVFYPPFILFFIFDQITAWSLLSFSIPIIAGLGFFLFLTQTTRNRISAAFGALVFAFSSVIICRTEDGLAAGHTLIWMPWVLLGIERCLRGKKIQGLLITWLSLALSLLAGWFQFTFYLFVLGFFYALRLWFDQRNKQGRRTLLLFLLLPFFLSILLTAFHWLPAVEALRYSPRGSMGTPPKFTSEHLMPAAHLLTLLIPDMFGHPASANYFSASEFKEGVISIGLVPFLLAVLGMSLYQKSKKTEFFLTTFILAVLLGIDTPVCRFLSSLNLPLISTFLPNRVFSLAVFSLAFLSAEGMDFLIRGKLKNFRSIIMLASGFFGLLYLAVFGVYVYEKFFDKLIGFSFFELGYERYLRIIVQESLLPFILLAALSFSVFVKKFSGKNRLLLVIFTTTIIAQVYSASRYLYFSDSRHEFPPNPVFSFIQQHSAANYGRFLSLSYSTIISNITTFYHLYNPEGVDAMYPLWYAKLFSYYQSEKSEIVPLSRIEVSFSDMLDRKKWNYPKTINLFAHLGVRYLVIPKDHDPLPPPPAYTKVFSHKWHTVFEYQYAFPKAYFVSSYLISENDSLTLERIFDPAFFIDGQVILSDIAADDGYYRDNKMINSNKSLLRKYYVQRSLLKFDPYYLLRLALGKLSKTPVVITNYQANQMKMEINNSRDGWVVINDSYFPGWEAEVDGLQVPVYRANYSFRAVPVPKGKHEITLTYVPKSFKIGLILSAGSLLLGSLIFIFIKKSHVHER